VLSFAHHLYRLSIFHAWAAYRYALQRACSSRCLLLCCAPFALNNLTTAGTYYQTPAFLDLHRHLPTLAFTPAICLPAAYLSTAVACLFSALLLLQCSSKSLDQIPHLHQLRMPCLPRWFANALRGASARPAPLPTTSLPRYVHYAFSIPSLSA